MNVCWEYSRKYKLQIYAHVYTKFKTEKCANSLSPTPREFPAYCLGLGLINMMHFKSICDFSYAQNAYWYNYLTSN